MITKLFVAASLTSLLLALGGCSTVPPLVPNTSHCSGCGAEVGNSGSGTVYVDNYRSLGRIGDR